MVTTPMLYFAAASTLASSGIQVTGSHNPKDYNGFKMVLAGRAIYGEEIQRLRQLMEAACAAAKAGRSQRRHRAPSTATASPATSSSRGR